MFSCNPKLCRQYVAHARQFQPFLPESLVDYITGAYVSLRTTDALGKDFYTTPRTLMAILRMSQALVSENKNTSAYCSFFLIQAKLRFSPEVAQADIDEAMRLLDASRASIYTTSPFPATSS